MVRKETRRGTVQNVFPCCLLMDSLLDARMNSRVGIPPLDRERIWTEIRDTLVHMALEKMSKFNSRVTSK
jgi:hypothetical protein